MIFAILFFLGASVLWLIKQIIELRSDCKALLLKIEQEILDRENELCEAKEEIEKNIKHIDRKIYDMEDDIIEIVKAM